MLSIISAQTFQQTVAALEDHQKNQEYMVPIFVDPEKTTTTIVDAMQARDDGQQNSQKNMQPFSIDLNQMMTIMDTMQSGNGVDDIHMEDHDQHFFVTTVRNHKTERHAGGGAKSGIRRKKGNPDRQTCGERFEATSFHGHLSRRRADTNAEGHGPRKHGYPGGANFPLDSQCPSWKASLIARDSTFTA
ncbi:hypothetical protein SUGI_0354300 [Cryptomeria japonica]|nr:hypothetical protein SUGI_0354300 [Cryptomeria japonica]